MSAAPPSLPSPASASAALPSPPAPAVDRQTCRPTPPAVSFEVEEDDRVVPLDAVGCPLGESHFKFNGYSYKASVELMTDIQGRLKAGDSAGLADLVNYPLHVNHPKAPGQIVKDRAAFIRGYAQIFSPAAVSAILAFDPRDVSCNYQGVMLGNGIVWVAQTTKGHQGIITLNSP